MSRRRVFALVAGYCLLLLLMAGCSGPNERPRIRGKVTYQDRSVGEQTLVLASPDKPGEFFSQRVPIHADGTFEGEVPRPGSYTIAIEESLAVQERRGGAGSASQVRLPQKYRTAATANLTWEIRAGENQQDFELKD
jgi:hypothetical protein